MKEQILQLHHQGKSYREIEKILKCSRSLISYYINPSGKLTKNKRQNKNRFRIRTEYKLKFGGKCTKCGYDKCLNALGFHHKNPIEKKFDVCDAIFGKIKKSKKEITTELNKCILLCANCHHELHSKNNFLI